MKLKHFIAAMAVVPIATSFTLAMQKGPPQRNDNPIRVDGEVAKTCIDCHSEAQGGRRAVIDEFGLASHHLQGAKLQPADCLVCHDHSTHRQGNVMLRNVDTLEVITLTGNPSVDPLEAAKLENFCLSCHDADGANGSVPFSDGVVPIALDASIWNIGIHKAGGAAGPMTCFGDGETFGCHNTAHGSAKRKLLAPYDASQPPVDGDPLREEEGMCYTCHDADGPSMFDIQTLFGKTSHHNVSSLDQQDGSKVECTNCHNTHYVIPSNLLADPDSGGWDPWLGNREDFCLTCHDGDPPIGVSYPSSSPGTGYDKSRFLGSTHSDAFGGRGCSHCHTNHGSDYKSILAEEYLTQDRTTYNANNFNMCWRCHDENNVVYGSNAYGTRHDIHVTNARTACIVCHDVHSPYDTGEEGLINFDYAVTHGYDISYNAGYNGSSAFSINYSLNRGNCYILCHSKTHGPRTYTRDKNPIVDCSPCH